MPEEKRRKQQVERMSDQQPSARNRSGEVISELFVLDPAVGMEGGPFGTAAKTEEEEKLLIEELEMSEEAQKLMPESESEQTELEDPDVALAAAYLAGDNDAFLRLYAKYEAPLLLYCRRMMVSERMAEDAFQEIWIRVFELRNRMVEIRYFRALLFRSARNLCLNMIRLEKFRAGSSDGLDLVVAEEQTQHSSEHKEMKELIRRALKKLPFEQREAFVLHEYSGYSYLEIAEMMGTNEVNVKVRAFRARIRLRKLITSWLGLKEDDDPSNMI